MDVSNGDPGVERVRVEWEGGMRFRGGRPGEATLLVDGSGKAAPSPVATLLIALASCAAIDVVEILGKRRTPPSMLGVEVEFRRATDPPRRLREVRLHFRVESASTREHVERAIELSFSKYCSVAHSLAPDTELRWELEMDAAPASV